MRRRRKRQPADSAELLRIGDDSYSVRHRCVLGEAMLLIGERGLAGASLRELARRLDIRQPSLYHYFDSKDQLVEQILQAYGNEVFFKADMPRRVDDLGYVLRHITRKLREVYSRPVHAAFMRFLFAVVTERPSFGRLFRRLLIDRVQAMAMPFLMEFAERGVLLEDDAPRLFRMVTNAIVLELMRTQVLHLDDRTPEETEDFADFVVDTALHGVLGRAARRAAGASSTEEP